MTEHIMTKQEASKHFNIPIRILDEYERWGLCSAVKKVMGKWQYDDSDLEKLSLIMTLHDVGFNSKEIEIYMRLLLNDKDTDKKQLDMLNEKRDAILDRIHFREKQLERLDYLRYEINKSIKVKGDLNENGTVK